MKETKLISEAAQVGNGREDVRRLCRLGGWEVCGSEERRVSWQAAVFLFWVHSRDSLCDLGPVTFPQHCCLSICDTKPPVSVT